MNWIILIVAGLFETGFAFCLGKMKEATGAEYCWWGAGFLLSLALSEPATFPRIFFLLLLIGAIVGLKLVGEPH